eukprot:CAMPEP_0184297722 /NCGR_PEP_ID=MMETSP1049-20130417/8600_1 /TAXON_ID=77928 /ORGANISM="Proteomonas sulcata, Strain CCMP704" /LENGTH=190 /DNA_ID=CAMNT_0026607567 /DNA_START=506 /DNA_END=1078 /DNA_ORIENTATION=+
MNGNIDRLRSGSLDLPHPFSPTQLYLKLLIFHQVRWAFFAVLVYPIGLMFIEVFVLTWEQAWVGTFLQEMLYFSVYVMISLSFRLHSRQTPNEQSQPNPVEQELVEQEIVQEEVEPAGEAPVDQNSEPDPESQDLRDDGAVVTQDVTVRTTGDGIAGAQTLPGNGAVGGNLAYRIGMGQGRQQQQQNHEA